MSRHFLILTFLAVGGLGCGAGEEETPTPTLPPDDTPEATPPDNATPFAPGEIPPGGDEVPEHVLIARETGTWALSPRGGPWDAITGELTIVELVDGEEESPACERIYALTGTVVQNSGCPDCLVVADIFHYLNVSTGECVHPDIPEHESLRRYGFDAVNNVLWLDWENSGLWIPWYDAELLGDLLTFEWTETYGYTLPDEDN